ncbi:MAG: glutathione S-transferase family protein [Deltaproteobacteria bacterium]|nr:glutathione S-transferase family protein [Deltaproteobacteria bacterium]
MSAEPIIKLYDFQTSPNCQRVKVVLEEKKLPYEKVPVDLRKGEQKKADFQKLNPYGKVPVMIDGSTVLYESCIINEYLDEKYPEPPLMPKDYAKRAKIRILIDYGLNHFDPPYQKLRQEQLKDAKERNQEVIESAKKELKNLLQRFEREIGEQPFLAGDFSLLDAALIPRFLRMEGFGVLPDPSIPKLGAWLQRMKDRPSVRAIM